MQGCHSNRGDQVTFTMILKLSAVSLGFMLLLPSVSAQSQDRSVEGRPEFVEPIVTTRLVSAQVQAPAPPADAASLLKRVELLEQQLAAMNTQLAATIAELKAVKAEPVKNPDASLGSTSTPAPEDAANQVAASNSDRGPGAINLAGIHVRVFGDVRLQGTDAKGDKPAFRMDDLDLFFNARLSDQFSALTDVNFHFKDSFSVNPSLIVFFSSINTMRTSRHRLGGFTPASATSMMLFTRDAGWQLPWIGPCFLSSPGKAASCRIEWWASASQVQCLRAPLV